MDLFAIVLLTITIVTIFGICFFIFICSLQPKVIRYLHRNKNRTYYIAATKKINQIDSDIYVNNLSLSISLNDRDKRAYLKILERSVRTGRSIQDEKNNNYNIKNDSHLNSLYFFRQYINKHLSSTTNNNSQRSTEI